MGTPLVSAHMRANCRSSSSSHPRVAASWNIAWNSVESICGTFRATHWRLNRLGTSKIAMLSHHQVGDAGAAQAALLEWVAVLFMSFQTPSMRSKLWRSTHESSGSEGMCISNRTEATSPACVTDRTRCTYSSAGGAAQSSKRSASSPLCKAPSSSVKKIHASLWNACLNLSMSH